MCFYGCVCRLLRRLVGGLWNVSVCFLRVCVGCFGDWSVGCGMCRCVVYGCVSVASEIGRWLVEYVGVFFTGVCRLLRRLVGSLWNVSVCCLWVCVGCFGDWSVVCGMCRCVFYGCVSVASEIGR